MFKEPLNYTTAIHMLCQEFHSLTHTINDEVHGIRRHLLDAFLDDMVTVFDTILCVLKASREFQKCENNVTICENHIISHMFHILFTFVGRGPSPPHRTATDLTTVNRMCKSREIDVEITYALAYLS